MSGPPAERFQLPRGAGYQGVPTAHSVLEHGRSVLRTWAVIGSGRGLGSPRRRVRLPHRPLVIYQLKGLADHI